ncbi:GntR family transcriptional regulator [Parasphingopyxis algicola]|uniref:GntR family transcriptional regulator n=1 Tax=Parasphingopyxis algicola TaxID=2026624 RepID=UPI0015A0EA82|nr:GntR family transcriptional regulator [Parasphingopyxis algicola]QLC24898.1 GntR family transcriptional regulator [Parasphingopyxis algicola]
MRSCRRAANINIDRGWIDDEAGLSGRRSVSKIGGSERGDPVAAGRLSPEETTMKLSISPQKALEVGAENLVYTHLRQMVMRHELPPGQRIYPKELTDELRASVTPIREALIRLSTETVVNEVPHLGFFTPDVTNADLRFLYESNRLALQWTLDEIVRPDRKTGLLKPPDEVTHAALASPLEAVETTDLLFMHLVRHSNEIHAMRNVSIFCARTFFSRLRECKRSEEKRKEVVRLCRLYAERDFGGLREALDDFHEEGRNGLSKTSDLLDGGTESSAAA